MLTPKKFGHDHAWLERVDPGPVLFFPRAQVPIPRARRSLVARVANWSHLALASCLASSCSKTTDMIVHLLLESCLALLTLDSLD